ncbi:MAG: patatin-like protein [Gammaproteobacteria bacterium]
MAKQELRLALVIYGGASLAVYMHGVTKELAKLVRASKVLRERPPADAATRFADGPDQRPADTEAVYFDALSMAAARHESRVVIDVIAGASAGAINGALLARTLVADASPDAVTDLWLDQADSQQLAAESVAPWRKWYVYPMVRLLTRALPQRLGTPEVRRKLGRLMRSRWFVPPFSGARLCGVLLDALAELERSRRPGSTLIPPGQRLDFYASLTDLDGYGRPLSLPGGLASSRDSSAPVVEREHAAYCHLTHAAGHARDRNALPAPEWGARTSDDAADFDPANIPALVWAARASASYAGAFPPFRHDELTNLLATRRLAWPGEARFLTTALRERDGAPLARSGDPRTRHFVDGGIVDNKPFRAVLDALQHRPADRPVLRRVVYIEPNPAAMPVRAPAADADEPGLLATLRAALDTIPRNQPIQDALGELAALDARVHINQHVLDAERPRLDALIRDQLRLQASQPLTESLLGYLREMQVLQASQEAGFAWQGYVVRRAWQLIDGLAARWPRRDDVPEALPWQRTERLADRLTDTLARLCWSAPEGDAGQQARLQSVFLDRFDVSVRLRRLQFLIRRINQVEPDCASEAQRVALGGLKAGAYRLADQLHQTRERALAALAPLRPGDEAGLLAEQLEALASALDLAAHDRAADALLSGVLPTQDAAIREQLLVEYVGFPFLDVVLLPHGATDDVPDPLTPVRTVRISPRDGGLLADQFDGLRCRGLGGFLGFFDRSHREHDYLWGRLNGAERAIDLLAELAPEVAAGARALKGRAFRQILTREAAGSAHRAALCADLLRALDAQACETDAHEAEVTAQSRSAAADRS